MRSLRWKVLLSNWVYLLACYLYGYWAFIMGHLKTNPEPVGGYVSLFLDAFFGALQMAGFFLFSVISLLLYAGIIHTLGFLALVSRDLKPGQCVLGSSFLLVLITLCLGLVWGNYGLYLFIFGVECVRYVVLRKAIARARPPVSLLGEETSQTSFGA